MIFKDLEIKLQVEVGKGIYTEKNIDGFVLSLNE